MKDNSALTTTPSWSYAKKVIEKWSALAASHLVAPCVLGPAQ
jgi:hypothetical protein